MPYFVCHPSYSFSTNNVKPIADLGSGGGGEHWQHGPRQHDPQGDKEHPRENVIWSTCCSSSWEVLLSLRKTVYNSTQYKYTIHSTQYWT